MWIVFVVILAATIGVYEYMRETDLFPPQAEPYKALVLSSALAAGVPWQIMAAEIMKESKWNPNAYNPDSGASGIAQFEPSTASPLGIDPWNPQSAIPGMANYLASLHKQLSSIGHPEWSYTLAAYDWGIGHVIRHLQAGVPPNQWPNETRDYVSVITKNSGVDQITAELFA